MKTFVMPGENIPVTAGAAIAAGNILKVGAIIGVAQETLTAAGDVTLCLTGVYDSPQKLTGEAWAVGAKIYWDDTAKKLTTTVGTNTLVGMAILAALAADTVGRVRLDGTTR